MNKTELAAALAHRMHLGDDAQAIRVAAGVLAHLFGERGIIAEELAGGRDVTVTGFGTFITRDRQPYVMNDPRGGEPIDVPSARVPAFHPGLALRRRVSEGHVAIWPVHR